MGAENTEMVAEGESMEREKDGQFTVFDKAEWGKKVGKKPMREIQKVD